jgi:lipopolysaccharide transport system ATP-binding protein
MTPLIEVTDIAKCYNIRHQAARYNTLRDDLAAVFRHPLHVFGSSKRKRDTLWALDGINFCMDAGESLALIGRNGSGKSTLLMILSEIVLPTRGRAVLRGDRVSLIGVGTGFHYELSGRENIYFNGALLGMPKKEIKRKLDAIVDFAGEEVTRLLDMPVKFYSSGMYVRLAFSIAAQLEPDILIVDEVLAVGDESFREKCMAHMSRIVSEGHTVIFVSHDMDAVSSLCSRGILLEHGKIVIDGAIDEAVANYRILNESLR